MAHGSPHVKVCCVPLEVKENRACRNRNWTEHVPQIYPGKPLSSSSLGGLSHQAPGGPNEQRGGVKAASAAVKVIRFKFKSRRNWGLV